MTTQDLREIGVAPRMSGHEALRAGEYRAGVQRGHFDLHSSQPKSRLNASVSKHIERNNVTRAIEVTKLLL